MKSLLLFKGMLLICLPFSVACAGDPAVEVPRLTKEFRSPDSGTRNRAALKIASMGPSAKAAVPHLAKLLSDPNGGVRSSAAYALRQINTAEAQQALTQYQK